MKRIAKARRSFVFWPGLCFCLAVIVAGCGGGKNESGTGDMVATRASVSTSSSSAPITTVSVLNLTKVSESRISRTVFDYTYRVTVKNSGAEQKGVILTLLDVGAGTTIVDGTVSVGTMATGVTVSPSDLIIVRHDRTSPFDLAAFRWEAKAETTPGPNGTGILLSGSASDDAISAVPDFLADLTAAEASQAANGDFTYYAFQINAVIADGATVGAVNAALTAAGARIIGSLRRNAALSLLVPGAASLTDLRAAEQKLRDSGAFAAATMAPVLQPLALPDGILPADAASTTGGVLHHAATAFTPAWNAINARPVVTLAPVEAIIVDFFGRGNLSGLSSTPSGIASFPASVKLPGDRHGYHVAGIFAGGFGGGSTERGRVTGAMPMPIPINVVDMNEIQLPKINHNEQVAMAFKLRDIFAHNPSANFVINLSLGYCNFRKTPKFSPSIPGECSGLTKEEKDASAYWWRVLVRNLDIGGKKFEWDKQVVQVSAAGNNEKLMAVEASAFNRAALGPTLFGQTRFAGGLVVENRVVNIAGPTPTPGGLNATVGRPPEAQGGSNIGGNISAIGTDVYSFLGPDSGPAPGLMSGTSMASPQVAGLAAWMWFLRPDLSPAELVERVSKIRFQDFPITGAAPAIDAYASLLSLDIAFNQAPVRTAILKASVKGPVSPGTKFNMADARLFLQAFFPKAYGLTAQTQPDYSRYDLNGDGFTGGTTRRPFDLKFDGTSNPFVPETIPFYADNEQNVMGLSESGVTDFEVLCYYVRSPLFQSNEIAAFEQELQNVVSPKEGRTITCANVEPLVLSVETTNPLYGGLPAKIVLSGFTATTPSLFSIFGSPGNSCGTGERGGPIYSSQVPADAQFYSVTTVLNMPYRLEASPNRKPCSSFFARKPNASGEQVWINATGRGQTFGGASLDWETQVRYSNGDASGNGRRCEVGVVPNSGTWVKNFDAVCNHAVNTAIILQ